VEILTVYLGTMCTQSKANVIWVISRLIKPTWQKRLWRLIFLPFCHNSPVWQTDRRTDRIIIA